MRIRRLLAIGLSLGFLVCLSFGQAQVGQAKLPKQPGQSGDQILVRGYTTKSGRYVAPHYRHRKGHGIASRKSAIKGSFKPLRPSKAMKAMKPAKAMKPMKAAKPLKPWHAPSLGYPPKPRHRTGG